LKPEDNILLGLIVIRMKSFKTAFLAFGQAKKYNKALKIV